MAVDHCAWDGTQPLAVMCMVWVVLVLAAPYGLYSWSDMCFLLLRANAALLLQMRATASM